MYFLSITTAIEDAFRSLLMSLCDVVYRLIIFLFDIFNMLGTAEILENSTIQSIYQHIGLILGLFMIFRVTFSAVEYVVNPDAMTDKQKGIFDIVKRIVIVVVLLGITPSIFKMAYKVQGLIIGSNIIPRIITNSSVSVDGEAGEELAWYTFSSFYTMNENIEKSNDVYDNCLSYYEVMEDDLKGNQTFRFAYNCLNAKGKYYEYTNNGRKLVEDYVITFDGILCLVVGIVILCMVFMYTIQVGVRVIQLSYLQLIAPIPIMLYLTPKGEERLNRWVKQCTSTYLDFFIRTAIIYLVIYIINILTSNDYNYFMESLGDLGGISKTYITIVMIIALMIFAKKVPELFKDLFPTKGGPGKFDFGLKPPKELTSAATFTAGTALGAVGGIATGIRYGSGVKGKVGGAFTGLARGAHSGMKTKGNIIANARKGWDAQRGASVDNFDNKYSYGEKLFNKYGDDISNAFETDYAATYNQMSIAKGNMITSDKDLKRATDELNAAYNSGDAGSIARALNNYNTIEKNNKDAHKQFDIAKAAHDSNREKYKTSARKEDAYKYYSDMNKLKNISRNESFYSSSVQQHNAPVQQQGSLIQQQSGSVQQPTNSDVDIIIPDVVNNPSRSELERQQSVQKEINNITENIDNRFDTVSNLNIDDLVLADELEKELKTLVAQKPSPNSKEYKEWNEYYKNVESKLNSLLNKK